MDKEKQVSLLRILVIFLGFGLVGIAITGLVRPAAAVVIPTTSSRSPNSIHLSAGSRQFSLSRPVTTSQE